MIITNFNRIYYIIITLIIFFSDQITKYYMTINHDNLVNKDLIFFSLDYVLNFGAAFNLFSGSRIFLSTTSIVITIILLYFILNKKNVSNINLLSFSLILGGTIGNGLDRITKGYVIDFINLNFIKFPVFNVADISINIGLIVLIYGFIKKKS